MPGPPILECVVNVSEGADEDLIAALVSASGGSFLDVHSDRHHNRSVFTLAGPSVEDDTRRLAALATKLIDLTKHTGAHPRFGAVDVVPFVPFQLATMQDAIEARNSFARWMETTLHIQCVLYGPERTLPEARKLLRDLVVADRRTGACAVGARNFLVAYNLWLRNTPLATAQQIATKIRRPGLRTLALQVGGDVQVSCNLVDPLGPAGVTPAAAFDLVAALAPIERPELVGLIPQKLLSLVPKSRWGELDLGEDKMIEARFTH